MIMLFDGQASTYIASSPRFCEQINILKWIAISFKELWWETIHFNILDQKTNLETYLQRAFQKICFYHLVPR